MNKNLQPELHTFSPFANTKARTSFSTPEVSKTHQHYGEFATKSEVSTSNRKSVNTFRATRLCLFWKSVNSLGLPGNTHLLYFQKSVNSFSSSTSFPNQKLVSRFPPPLIQSSHSQVLPKSKVDIWNHRSSRMKKLVKVGISFDAERQSRFVLTQTRSW